MIDSIGWRRSADSQTLCPCLESIIIFTMIAFTIFVVLFMCKPFFAPSAEEATSVDLEQFEERHLQA